MTDNLRTLFSDLADRVVARPAHPLAATAWKSARRARRRRRAAAVAAVAVLAGGLAFGVDRLQPDAVRVPSASSPGPSTDSPTETARLIHTAPADPGSLSWTETRLPRQIGLSTDHAVPLAAEPIGRALAVFQVFQLDRVLPVLVLGDDGQFRRIDGVRLVPNVDANGNADAILDLTSLDPEGVRVALLQPNKVIVVDLRNAAVREYGLPGYNVGVRWDPNGSRFLVFRENADSVWVDLGTGAINAIPDYGETLALKDDGDIVDLLPAVVEDDLRLAAPAILRRIKPSGEVSAIRQLSPMLGSWHGPAFLRRGLVAGAGFTTRVEATGLKIANPQGVAVLEDHSGRLHRLLAIDYSRSYQKGCCPVLGWLDDETLLIGNGHAQILAWNTNTGGLTRVAEFPGAAMTLGNIRP